MMNNHDKLINLLHAKKIDKWEYDTYVLYELNDQGRTYLKNSLESLILENPMKLNKHNVLYCEGRRSIWRDIKSVINHINSILEGVQHDNRPKFPDLEWYGRTGN